MIKIVSYHKTFISFKIYYRNIENVGKSRLYMIKSQPFHNIFYTQIKPEF